MYRALHSLGRLGLEYGDVPTGVIFGFFNQLRQVCQQPQIASNRVAIFADSRKSHRKKAFPDYKGKRHQDKTPEEWETHRVMTDQRDLLVARILPDIGLPVYRQTGLESDDLMASAARELTMDSAQGKNGERKGVIVTADGDLYQCINKVIHWYDPQRRIYHDVKSFEAAKGIKPHRWGRVKQLAGCHTDNVPGIPGVAEKTAVAFLNGTLPSHHHRYKVISSPEGQEIIERNCPLVVLPHPRTKPVKLREPEYKPEVFFAFCKKYGLASFLTDEKGWRAFFRGPKQYTPRRRGEHR
jgi:DNA polymerase-1